MTQSNLATHKLVSEADHTPAPYGLTPEAVDGFWTDGVIGPLVCEAPELDHLLEQLLEATPARRDTCFRNIHDPQDYLPEVHSLARHPSILHPVAQLLDCQELGFYEGRFRVKDPRRPDHVLFHQDGGRKFGLFPDGTAIPSLTVHLSLDGADSETGAVVLIPGTHHALLGDWEQGFGALKDLQHTLDTSGARVLTTPANHFHIFHSWAVHNSLTNSSNRPRAALVLRYMDRRHAVEAGFPHHVCEVAN